MAQGNLSEIQILGQTRELPFHLHPADESGFRGFIIDSGKVQDDIHYNIPSDKSLTDRAKEVMLNVCDFVMSYNFDDSDSMTDYFRTNFYLALGIGS